MLFRMKTLLYSAMKMELWEFMIGIKIRLLMKDPD